jgi:arylsulfatase A-like enzyme
VYLALSTLLAAGAAHLLHQRSVARLAASGLGIGAGVTAPKYLVIMVLDGAQPGYLDVVPLPHLDALRAQGTQFTNAMAGILEAETPAGHTTIATGSRPDRSGILGFDWANDDDRFSLFNPDKMPALEQIMENAQAPTIGALYKQRFPRARVVAISGHKYYAAAPLGGPAADAIIYYQGDSNGRYVPVAVPGHVPPSSILDDPRVAGPSTHLPDGGEDHLVTKMAVQVVRTMHPRMLLMNYPEFDWPVGHIDGGMEDPAAVTTLMTGFDEDLGQLEETYRKAGILDQTLFVITADHGMAPITHFIPYTTIRTAIAKAGTTPTSIAYNHSAYVWLRDPRKAGAVAQNLARSHDPGISSVYYLSRSGRHVGYRRAAGTSVHQAVEVANQYLLQTLLNGHQPAVVLFCRTDATTSSNATHWRADHGGPVWQSQHIPLILAGPGIRRGVVTSRPAQLDDVAPTVLADLGVSPRGMEGQVLTDALEHPSGAEQRAREAESKQLQPVVHALIWQDTYQRLHVPYRHH